MALCCKTFAGCQKHGAWQKFTNWEAGVRVPLIIRDPALPQSHGKKSTALVELIDVFPTLADLSGLKPPGGSEAPLDGLSLAPLLRTPTLGMLPTRDWALSQYPRCPAPGTPPADYYKSNKCEFVERSEIPFMGYSLRTDTFRFTEWATWNGTVLRPMWDKLVGTELYSHDAGSTGLQCNDKANSCFDDSENINLAVDPAHAADVKALSAKLHEVVAGQFPGTSEQA